MSLAEADPIELVEHIQMINDCQRARKSIGAIFPVQFLIFSLVYQY
jgi:hypothetical protein